MRSHFSGRPATKMPRKWKYLRERNIPDWIKDSPYLESLLENGALPENGLRVPRWCLKRDTSIKCFNDVLAFLRTAQYWLLPDSVVTESTGLFRYLLGCSGAGLKDELIRELEEKHPVLSGLWSVVTASRGCKMKHAARAGSLCILRHLCESFYLEVNEVDARAAIDGDQEGCLQYIHSRGITFTNALTRQAVYTGSIRCLMYMHQNGGPLSMSALLSATCGRPGQLQCLKYMLQQEIPHFYLWQLRIHCETSISLDNTETIDTLVAHFGAAVIPHAVFMGAARSGKLSVLKHCIEQGYKVHNPGAVLGQCAHGCHLQCLRYLHGCNFAMSAQTMEGAAEGGNMQCMRFLLELGCPTSASVCRILAKHANLAGLKYVRSIGSEWDANTCTAAAKCGSLDCLQYAHENGCPWDESTCAAAATGGHLSCLRYAHENGCPWKRRGKSGAVDCEWISVSAARAPTAECLRYVVERGAPLRREAARKAAGVNCVASLEVLLSAGCPWNVTTCREAVREGALESLRFLHESGCPWDKSVFVATTYVEDEHAEIDYMCRARVGYEKAVQWKARVRLCAEYLKQHNCPGAE